MDEELDGSTDLHVNWESFILKEKQPFLESCKLRTILELSLHYM